MVCDYEQNPSNYKNIQRISRLGQPDIIVAMRKVGIPDDDIDQVLEGVETPTDLVGLIGLPNPKVIMNQYAGVIQRLNQQGLEQRSRKLQQRQQDLARLLEEKRELSIQRLAAHRQAHIKELQAATPAQREAKIRRVFGDRFGNVTANSFASLQSINFDQLDTVPDLNTGGVILPEGLKLPKLKLRTISLELKVKRFDLPSLQNKLQVKPFEALHRAVEIELKPVNVAQPAPSVNQKDRLHELNSPKLKATTQMPSSAPTVQPKRKPPMQAIEVEAVEVDKAELDFQTPADSSPSPVVRKKVNKMESA